MCLDAVYSALSASAPSARGPAEKPSPALSLTVSCPKLALVLERALAPDPAENPPSKPSPGAAATREALELAVLGLYAGVQIPGGCGTCRRCDSSRHAGTQPTCKDSSGREGGSGRHASMQAQGHDRTRDQSGSSSGSVCWQATAAAVQVTVSTSAPAETEPCVLLASPDADMLASPTGAAQSSPSGRFLAHEWGTALASVGPGEDAISTRAEPEALRVYMAPMHARLTLAVAARLARLGDPLGFLADSIAELAREAGPASVRAAVAAVTSRGGRRRLLTDAPATLRRVKVGVTQTLLYAIPALAQLSAPPMKAVALQQSGGACTRWCRRLACIGGRR